MIRNYVFWTILALALLLPYAAAEQVNFEDTAGVLSATHEFPSHTVPGGEDFIISGTANGAGVIDTITFEPLIIHGDCSIQEQATNIDGTSAFWYAVLEMDGAHCAWHRNVTGNNVLPLGGTVPVVSLTQAGNVASFQLTDFGQDADESAFTYWLPLFIWIPLTLWFLHRQMPLLALVTTIVAIGLFISGLPWGPTWGFLALLLLAWVEAINRGLGVAAFGGKRQ